ncbi:MAG: TIGR03435 family protein [Acidobacteriia bacterium]|nr:TIGR03435 family protein [Terriglobia bacterium]
MFGLPGWAGPDGARDVEYYDVDAVAPVEKPTRSQLQIMLQSLLAERFQLRAHRETRDLPVYALMIAKGGAKFKAITGEPTPISPTLFTLTESLSRHVDRPIVDRTDLTGYYEFPSIFKELAQDPPGSASGVSDLLRANLGLELKPERVRMEVLVVDHVERPSAN